MPVLHAFQLLFNTQDTWRAIHDRKYSVGESFLGHAVVFALIPAVAGFLGTTLIGWRVGDGELVKLTTASGLQIAVAYYLAMLAGVLSVGWMIHWMSRTYGTEQSIGTCVALATFTATPLFLVGICQAYPVIWINFVVGLPALAYTVYLFYSGVPIMMEISTERAFLFASAVMAFGLVAFVGMLVVTVLLWGAGLAPSFTV